MSRTVKDSGLRADFPVSNITPRRMTGVRSGVNRIGQPAASTRVPGAVPGQRSFASSTPSPSESLKRWHPTRSEEHTSELQSQSNLVCRLLLEKKKHTCNTGSVIKLTLTWVSTH